MLVTKRNGRQEPFDAEKINRCVTRACEGYNSVSVSEIIRDAEVQLVDGIKTSDIDVALIASARGKIYKEPEYSYVTAGLLLQQIYKEVKMNFQGSIEWMVSRGLLDVRMLEYNLDYLEAQLDYSRDKKFKYLGLQTVYDRYLIKDRDTRKVLETPQAFFMRVAMGLALNEKKEVRHEWVVKFYDILSTFRALSSTPTLFNSGSTNPQLSSCFLSTVDDSIDGIFDSLWQNARKSKYAGGLGFDITPLRGKGSYIKGTNGETSGCVSFLKLYNDMLVAVNQGGKRRGSGCAYMEPWHIDIFDFLSLRKNTGDDRVRTHDMNTALWIPDLFLQCVEEDVDWYLFSPNDCKLHEVYGEEFTKEYSRMVRRANEGSVKHFKVVRAKDLWKEILKSLYETGHPWITFKDTSNKHYPLKNVGIIRSSNLCTEILEHSVPSKYKDGVKVEVGETAVCNLASINLTEHISQDIDMYDKEMLGDTIETVVRMLDNVIDLNYYPTEEARNSSMKHRFIGMGSMGWQDLFYHAEIDYDSNEAISMAREVQGWISHCATIASTKLGEERGNFPSFEESTWSTELGYPYMRNACVQAIAPTATISFIAGCSQSIEPNFSVLYVYSTLSGNFMMINDWFVHDMKQLGMWNTNVADQVKAVNGDLSKLPDEVVPKELKYKYRTAFELDQHKLIDVAAARQKYIDQGQSLNLYNGDTSLKKLSDMYLYAWKKGLKTTYYLRNKAASEIEQSSTVTAPRNTEIECYGCQ